MGLGSKPQAGGGSTGHGKSPVSPAEHIWGQSVMFFPFGETWANLSAKRKAESWLRKTRGTARFGAMHSQETSDQGLSWHLPWEIAQHLLLPAISTLIKEKLFPNLICLYHGAHWRTVAERKAAGDDQLGGFLPVKVLWDVCAAEQLASTARSASMNLHWVLH